MRKLLLATAAALLAACGPAQPTVISITATAPPVIISNTPTPRPPTSTPRPTNTPRPTDTPEPEYAPVDVSEVESALKDAGYRRFPFKTADGSTGFTWAGNNSYELVRTWDDGTIELRVLHDKSVQLRSDHMERHFAALDSVLPPGFMARLREENDAYNRSVRPEVSGEPEHIYPFNDEWHTVWAQYYINEVNLGGYWVDFSLWWWQSTCPSEAVYCYYEDFPGLEFEGDSSFVFYSVLIWLPSGPGLTSGST